MGVEGGHAYWGPRNLAGNAPSARIAILPPHDELATEADEWPHPLFEHFNHDFVII